MVQNELQGVLESSPKVDQYRQEELKLLSIIANSFDRNEQKEADG